MLPAPGRALRANRLGAVVFTDSRILAGILRSKNCKYPAALASKQSQHQRAEGTAFYMLNAFAQLPNKIAMTLPSC